MGYHLKKKLGDKVYFLAVTTDGNYPHTTENELAKKGIELAWITNGKVTKNNFSSCLLGRPSSGNWSEVVDGILYFNSSEQIAPERKDKYFIKGKISQVLKTVKLMYHNQLAFFSNGNGSAL